MGDLAGGTGGGINFAKKNKHTKKENSASNIFIPFLFQKGSNKTYIRVTYTSSEYERGGREIIVTF